MRDSTCTTQVGNLTYNSFRGGVHVLPSILQTGGEIALNAKETSGVVHVLPNLARIPFDCKCDLPKIRIQSTCTTQVLNLNLQLIQRRSTRTTVNILQNQPER